MVCKLKSNKFTIIRTCIFTIGHYCIDITTAYFVTGAKIELLAISSLISPIINAGWYYAIDKYFFSKFCLFK